MTSIIKVDTLQTAAGGVPTASDLGLNVTGSVLQVKNDTVANLITNSSDGWMDTGLSVTITPSSATNYFYVMFEGEFFMTDTSNAKGFGFNIYKDNTAVTTSPNDGLNRPYDHYQDDTSERIFTRSSKTWYDVTGTLSPVTFTVKFTAYQGDVTPVGMSFDSETQRSLTVMEIAG